MKATHRTQSTGEPVALLTVKHIVKRDDLAYATYKTIDLYNEKPTKKNIVEQLKNNLRYSANEQDCDEEWFKLTDRDKYYEIVDRIFPSFI